MEESQEILFNSLANAGVPIPPAVLSVEDLAPETFLSICAHSLRIIFNSESFPITLPDSMSDRFKVCTDLASSVKDLGYIGDMSFHKFLYPSDEDMYTLIRFLVGRLSESSRTAASPNTKGNNAAATVNIENLEISSKDADKKGVDLDTEFEGLKLRSEEDTAGDDVNRGNSATSNIRITCMESNGGLTPYSAGEEVEIICQPKLQQAPMSLHENSLQTRLSINQESLLSDEVTLKSLELQQLQQQHDLLKTAVEMACDEHKPLEMCITQLSDQIDARRHNLAQVESKWIGIIKPLKEKKRNLEEAVCAEQPESQGRYQKWKKIEEELDSVLSDTKHRDEEISKLSTEIEKLPKLATRGSYIERIKEITKNSRKQDTDMERILKETRELQLESNMIQERLHRTYAVVDEALLRESKKEQAHILLTAIHESFTEISEKVLATDRARREATDLETKVLSMSARSLNMNKLQADLDAIRKENKYLQSCFGEPFDLKASPHSTI